MGVIILAKSYVAFSLVIMERARYITPLWLILRRGLYPLHRHSPPAKQSNVLAKVRDPVTQTNVWPPAKMKPWVATHGSSLGEQRAMVWWLVLPWTCSTPSAGWVGRQLADGGSGGCVLALNLG